MSGYRLAAPPELSDSDLAFLARYRWITDYQFLRKQCQELHDKVVNSSGHVHGCIADFYFLRPAVQTSPHYAEALALRQSGGLWLEIGACFGTDLRQVLLDGWPADQIVGFDIIDTYFNLGLDLFGDKQPPFREFYKDMGLLKAACSSTVSVCYAGRVLHVLNEAGVRGLLGDMHYLLKGDGILFGSTMGQAVPGPWQEGTRYLHSPDSLAQALAGAGFIDINVQQVSREEFLLRDKLAEPIEADFRRWRAQGRDLKFLMFRGRRAAS